MIIVIVIVYYEDKYEFEWDKFVQEESINGNFLQTRNFLNYHNNDKYNDASIMFTKEGRIAAVLPANEIEKGKVLLSHQGSTFGGLIVGKDFVSTKNYNWIFGELIEYFKEKGYERVELKMPHWLYRPDERQNELLDYYFQLNGFTNRGEVGFYIDLKKLDVGYENKFEKLKKRKLKKAFSYNLEFKKISSDKELYEFYNVLRDNMQKFSKTPVHTYEELADFKNNRLKNIISFYGVYYETSLIAGSMVFNFCDGKVFHTQYLASKQDMLEYCPNEFLYANLIKTAKTEGYRFLSFGTATLEQGNIYNESLGLYKEGFNTDTYVNKTYIYLK